MSTTVGSGSSDAPAGDAIQVSIVPPAPGASTTRISGHARPSIQEEPIVVNGRSEPSSVARHSSGGRCPTVAVTVTRPPPTARVLAMVSPSTRRTGSPAGPPPDGSKGKRHGCVRPRSVTRATTASGPSHAGPGRLSIIQPVRSVSAQLPTGRSRSGARATAPDEPSAGPTNRVGETLSKKSGSSTPTPAIQRPSGEYAGRPDGPREGQDLARLTARERHLPDRGSRSAIRVLPGVGRERDGLAVRTPGNLRDAAREAR